MTDPRTRPARTAAHGDRDALLQQFHDAGLQPILSTNGGIPEADIELTTAALKDGGGYGELVEARLTERGAARLRGDEVPEIAPMRRGVRVAAPVSERLG